MPGFIEPMLAVYGRPFDSPTHLFEPKWDGIRCLFRYDGEVTLFSRSGRDISSQFPEVCALHPLEASRYILDGELIALNAVGKPCFDRVRNRLILANPTRIRSASLASPAIYVLFDLLHCEGDTLLDSPLIERRERLEKRFKKERLCLLSPVTEREGTALYRTVCVQGLEGIIAKERLSRYTPGRRSGAWIKVRRTRTDTFWIVGYATRHGTHLRSLAVADGEGPTYAGHVGSGLDERTKDALLRTLSGLPAADPDRFAVPHALGRSTVWVEPRLMCRVEYLERGERGGLRHPVFRGLVTEPDGNEGERK